MKRDEQEQRHEQEQREARAERERQGHPSRREFAHAACAAVGATAMVSTVWDLRMINAAAAASLPTQRTAAAERFSGPSASSNLLAATGPDYKALVCIFLFGGNDANNLLVPTDPTNYSAYSTARGALAIPSSSLLPISPVVSDGRTYGLHPSCPELASLFGSGNLAMLCNVGTLVGPVTRAQYLAKTAAVPRQLFSHNDQQVQWQTSVPDRPFRTGWGGRAADLLHSLNGNATVSMSISLAGTNTFEVGNVVNTYNVSTNGAPSLNAPSAQVQVIKDLIALNHANLYEGAYADVTNTAITNASLLNAAIQPTTSASYWTTPFPTTSIGSQLRMIARLIAARGSLGHSRQIFFASVGGYDLHSGQVTAGTPTAGPHANLFADLSKAMGAFYRATEQMAVAPNVTSFTTSDFGRTFPVNGTAGSDHGWGNHQIVMGGAVKGNRLYGTFPNLTINGPDDTDTGRFIPTTSVDEYSATLAKWFGVSSTDMPTVFPNIGRFANPDLGFLG